MTRNELIAFLQATPKAEELQEILPLILDYLKDAIQPCDCCRQQSRYGCSSSCQCSQPALNICENCGHDENEHLIIRDGNRCIGKWNPSGCSCREFVKPRYFGDR